MGRLVDPISQEEFEKLPKWRQWMSNNFWVALLAIAVIGLTVWILRH